MKGHMEDGKFHPHKPYKKGVRKSRDQDVKQQGVKIERKARTVSSKKLPDMVSRSDNHRFEIENGEISFRLDDFGWYWSGEEDQLNTFMARMEGTKLWGDLIEDLEDAGITVDMLKPKLLKNLSGKLTEDNDDGLYSLSGDNVRWKFGDDYENENAIEGEVEHFLQEGELKEGEEKEFEEEFWNHFNSPTYEKWLEVKGSGFREQLKDGIKNAVDYDDLADAYKDVHDNIVEEYHEFFFNEAISPASWGAVEAIQARRNKEGVTQ